MTSANTNPDYYDDLALSFEQAWNVIQNGLKDRNSPAHAPVVGTVDEFGAPQLRVMILRDACRDTRMLRFNTDARSQKITQMRANGKTSIQFYDAAAKVQLRLSGKAVAIVDGAVADTAWSQSTPFARRRYMAEASPGSEIPMPSSGLPDWIQGRQTSEPQLVDARPNFATLLFQAEQIEWLYLANAGHRRARWNWDAQWNLWDGRWLIP